MFIKQLYTSCISEAAYYIESNGEAAIIDPLRDIEEYIQLAKERNATIKYIFETHFHADFVSGHLDLAKATGAPIIFGPDTETKLPVQLAKHHEVFSIGDIYIKVLHTPGHTLESTCYLLIDSSGKDHCIFTGDTLFVGDVGRPDLAQKGNNTTMTELAGMLYDSIQKNIIPLADDVIVYPAHGPGSSCGKNLGPETSSSIGTEKKNNYALLVKDRDSFIKAVTEGIAEPPVYFPINVKINKEGYENLDVILEKGLTPLSIESFKKLSSETGTIILDTRNANDFTNGFVPESISIGLEGRFAEWAGSLLPFDKQIILVTEPGKEKESIVRLTRVGFENIHGYLEGGFEAWRTSGEQIDLIIDVEADEVAMDLPFDKKMVILDVRKPSEYADGHIKQAVNIPLSAFQDPASMTDLEDEQNLYVQCGGGYRSVIAASILKRNGYHNLRNIIGGWSQIKELKGKFKIEKEKAKQN
jgi:hydroxyacylglutathione hydrolase